MHQTLAMPVMEPGSKRSTLPFIILARCPGIAEEKTMNATRIPGNEPDLGDMSTDVEDQARNDQPAKPDLPDDEAEDLGDFA
jgi:hypothetical protein